MYQKCLEDRDVAAAAMGPKTPMVLHKRISGGSFWDTIKSGISKAANFVTTHGPKVLAAVNAVRPIFGMGMRGGSIAMPEDEPPAKHPRGGGFIDESSDAQMAPEDMGADFPGPRGAALPLKTALPLKKLDAGSALPFRSGRS